MDCGKYLKLSGGNIELGCPGNILLKAANVNQTGPATLDTPPLTFPKGYGGTFTVTDPESGDIKPFTSYRVTSPDGEVLEGISDSSGKTAPLYSLTPGNMKIEFPDTLSDEQFKAIDKSTGAPVSGYAYFITSESGESISGYTDNNGYTQRIETKDESTVEVLWGEDAIERMNGGGYNA